MTSITSADGLAMSAMHADTLIPDFVLDSPVCAVKELVRRGSLAKGSVSGIAVWFGFGEDGACVSSLTSTERTPELCFSTSSSSLNWVSAVSLLAEGMTDPQK